MGSQIVSIVEAARILGCSERTIRRRLHAGELRGEKEAAPGGYTWRVAIDHDTAGPAVSPGTAASQEASQTVQALLEMLRGRDAQLAALQQDRERLIAQAAMFQERTTNLQQRVLLLEGPKDRSPSWWRRLFSRPPI